MIHTTRPGIGNVVRIYRTGYSVEIGRCSDLDHNTYNGSAWLPSRDAGGDLGDPTSCRASRRSLSDPCHKHSFLSFSVLHLHPDGDRFCVPSAWQLSVRPNVGRLVELQAERMAALATHVP